MIKIEIEPVKCKCGRKAILRGSPMLMRYMCSRDECWIGPYRKTISAAVKAWNAVMEKKS